MNTKNLTKTALALAVLAAFPIAHAQGMSAPVPQATPQTAGASVRYAQLLVNSMATLHPELVEIDLHAAPAGATQSVIVAAKSTAKIGRPSGADAVAVFKNSTT